MNMFMKIIIDKIKNISRNNDQIIQEIIQVIAKYEYRKINGEKDSFHLEAMTINIALILRNYNILIESKILTESKIGHVQL